MSFIEINHTSFGLFKADMLSRNATPTLQYILLDESTEDERYSLYFLDSMYKGNYVLYTSNTTEKDDFENNYKESANNMLQQNGVTILKDSSGNSASLLDVGDGNKALAVKMYGELLTDHNYLESLQGGILNEYYHLSQSEWNALTKGLSTAIHTHDHTNLNNSGTTTHATLDSFYTTVNPKIAGYDSHLNDTTIHFTESSIDHTELQNVGNNTHSEIDSHINAINNPHDVTATQVGKDTAQWNASKIQGTLVDDSSKSDAKVLSYKASSGNIEWIDQLMGEPLACVQTRKTSRTDIPSSWENIFFETTDIETDDLILEHSDSNRDRILIKQTGVYLVYWSFDLDEGGENDVEVKIRKNDTLELIGSYSQILNNAWGAGLNPSKVFIASLSLNDYISLQLKASGSNMDIENNIIFGIVRLNGAKGEKGENGSGSTINIKNNGTNVTNTPHDTINFTNCTVEDQGTGQVDITVTGQVEAIFTGGVTNVGWSSTKEAAFGSNAANGGVCIIEDGEVYGISIVMNTSWQGGTCQAQFGINDIWYNGVNQYAEINGSNTDSAYIVLPTPISYSAGDRLHVRTVTNNFDQTGADATLALFIRKVV